MSFNPNIQDSSANTREERTERAERGQTRDVRSERSGRVHSNVRNFQSRNTNTVERERVGSKEAWMSIGDSGLGGLGGTDDPIMVMVQKLFEDNLERYRTTAQQAVTYTTVYFDASQPDNDYLATSCVVLLGDYEDALASNMDDAVVPFRLMAVEGTSKYLETDSVYTDQEEFTTRNYPTTAVTSDYVDFLKNSLANQFGGSPERFISLEGETIFTKGIKEEDLVRDVDAYIKNSKKAIENAISAMHRSQGIDLSSQNYSDSTLFMSTTSGNPDIVLPGNVHVRGDVKNSLSIRNKNNNNNKNNGSLNGTQDTLLGTLSGYFDAAYSEQAEYRSGDADKRYLPLFIITDIDARGVKPLELILLMLSTALMPVKQNIWQQGFYTPETNDNSRRNYSVKSIFNDPVIPNPPSPEILESKDFDPADEKVFLEILRRWFFNEVQIAIDIPYYGHRSWALGSIRDAFLGDRDCEQDLLNAANTMTGGAFSNFFDPKTTPIVLDHIDQALPFGYVRTEDGQEQDLRHIFNTLAGLELLGYSNPDVAQQQYDWINNAGGNASISMDRAVDQLLDPIARSAVYQGVTQRVYLNAQFLGAIAEALKDAQIKILTSHQARFIERSRNWADNFGTSTRANGNYTLFQQGGGRRGNGRRDDGYRGRR